MEAHTISWIVGAVFVALAVIISFLLVIRHLQFYLNPEVQRYIIRICFMVPIYAVDSWLSLRFKDASVYLDTARDCYEAYALYNFFGLMIAYLGGEERIVKRLEGSPPNRWPFPFRRLKPFYVDGKFLRLVKRGILQFAIIKPVNGILALIFELSGVWDQGVWKAANGWPWIAFINNASITAAMYYLIAFYYALREILKPFDPWPKFLIIKSVIFFTFWQEVVLSGLVKIQVIRQIGHYTADDVATGNFIICFEMFIAAIAHHWAFPYSPFKEDARTRVPLLKGIKHVVDHRDMVHDTKVFLPTKFRPGPVQPEVEDAEARMTGQAPLGGNHTFESSDVTRDEHTDSLGEMDGKGEVNSSP